MLDLTFALKAASLALWSTAFALSLYLSLIMVGDALLRRARA